MSWKCGKCSVVNEDINSSCYKCSLPRKICDYDKLKNLGHDEKIRLWDSYKDDAKYYAAKNSIASDVIEIIKSNDDTNKLFKKLKHNATKEILASIRNLNRYMFDAVYTNNRLDILKWTAERDQRELVRILKQLAPDVLTELYERHSPDCIIKRCVCGFKPIQTENGYVCATEDCHVHQVNAIAESVEEWNNFISGISGEA